MFPHTVVEMRGILAAAESVVAHQTYRGLYGPMAESIILRGATPSDIREMAAGLEMDLRAHRVRVSEEPRYEPVYQISEEALAESLRVYVQYRENERALDVDVHSISNIARIRKGRQYSAVETCRALFVTTNSGVVRGAHDFYRQEFGGNFVGLCVTDGYLANLMWL